jgi:uncharacterized protein (DUF1697 family)
VVALLRAVNVGGRTLSMSDLKAVVARLGFHDVRTLLQSGNVTFRAGRLSPAQVERRLERELQTQLGLTTDVFVRTAAEWAELIAANPFPRAAATDPAHLVLMILKGAPSITAVQQLRAAIKGPEEIEAGSRSLYIIYPDGIGRSKLTNKVLERALGTAGTARNWNTVMKLAAVMPAAGGEA